MSLGLAIWAGSLVVNKYLSEVEKDLQDEAAAEAKRAADERWLKELEIPGTASPGDVLPIIFGAPIVACKKVKDGGKAEITHVKRDGDSVFYQSALFTIGSPVDSIVNILTESSISGVLESVVWQGMQNPNGLGSDILIPQLVEAYKDGVPLGWRLGEYPQVFFAPGRAEEDSSGNLTTSSNVATDGTYGASGREDTGDDEGLQVRLGIGLSTFPDGMPDGEDGPLPTKVRISYRPIARGGYFVTTQDGTILPRADGSRRDTLYSLGQPRYSAATKSDDNEYLDTDQSRYKGVSCVNISEISATGGTRLASKFFAAVEREPYTGFPDVDKWSNYSERDWGDAIYRTLKGANPVGVALEVLLNTEWGLGINPSDIDSAAFEFAAEVMFDEELFMSMAAKSTSASSLLDSCATVGEFIMFENRTTGLVSIKTLRSQGNPDAVLTDSDIVKLRSLSVTDSSATPAQVEVVFTDAGTREPVTYSNANDNGTLLTFSLSMPYVTDSSVADLVLARTTSNMTRRVARVAVDVSAASATALNVGDVVSMTLDTFAIPQADYRLLLISESKQTSGTVTLTLVTDMWSKAATPYYKRSEELLTTLARVPKPVASSYITASPYFEIASRTVRVGDPASGIPPFNFGTVIAESPSKFHTKFGIPDMETEQYHTEAIFSTFSDIGGAIGIGDTEIPLSYVDTLPTLFGVYYLGDELVQVTGIVISDEGDDTISLRRGCHDTVPKAHAEGTMFIMLRDDGLRNWTASTFMSPPTAPISQFKIITFMRNQEGIDPNEVEYSTWDPATGGRQFLPPTPTNLKVNGSYFSTSTYGDLVMTWSHRQHLDDYHTKDLKSFRSVDGTENNNHYFIEFYFDGATEFDNSALILDDNYTFTNANIIAANGGVEPTEIRIVMSGYLAGSGTRSWQSYELVMNYGPNQGEGWDNDWSGNWSN